MAKIEPAPRLLLVEGTDDYHVLRNLKTLHGIQEEAFKIQTLDGIDEVLDSIKVLLDLTERLGIIIDADVDLDQRWNQVLGTLGAIGYTVLPPQPDPHGTIITQNGKAAVGIWIMPDNRVPGKLEDFVAFLVPTDDLLWPLATERVDSLPKHPNRFADKDRAKALIHTWLAWQREPGKPMGAAITRRYVDGHAPQALGLIDWLHRLYD